MKCRPGVAEYELTPNSIVADLVRLNGDLREMTQKLKDRERAAADAKVGYQVAYSSAFLRSQGTIDARKHQAVLATEKELLAKEYAEAELSCTRADIAALRVAIDSARSGGALLRAEMNL